MGECGYVSMISEKGPVADCSEHGSDPSVSKKKKKRGREISLSSDLVKNDPTSMGLFYQCQLLINN
jgi:hypothetical protein